MANVWNKYANTAARKHGKPGREVRPKSLTLDMLDIVNIAHPAFILLGSYIAYVVNVELGVDPIVVSILVLPAFYALGGFVYQVYYVSFEKYGQESLRGLAFFFGLLFVTEVCLLLIFGVDYRSVDAVYIGSSVRLGTMIWKRPPLASTLPPNLAIMPGTRSVYFLYSTGSLTLDRATQ